MRLFTGPALNPICRTRRRNSGSTDERSDKEVTADIPVEKNAEQGDEDEEDDDDECIADDFADDFVDEGDLYFGGGEEGVGAGLEAEDEARSGGHPWDGNVGDATAANLDGTNGSSNGGKDATEGEGAGREKRKASRPRRGKGGVPAEKTKTLLSDAVKDSRKGKKATAKGGGARGRKSAGQTNSDVNGARPTTGGISSGGRHNASMRTRRSTLPAVGGSAEAVAAAVVAEQEYPRQKNREGAVVGRSDHRALCNDQVSVAGTRGRAGGGGARAGTRRSTRASMGGGRSTASKAAAGDVTVTASDSQDEMMAAVAALGAMGGTRGRGSSGGKTHAKTAPGSEAASEGGASADAGGVGSSAMAVSNGGCKRVSRRRGGGDGGESEGTGGAAALCTAAVTAGAVSSLSKPSSKNGGECLSSRGPIDSGDAVEGVVAADGSTVSSGKTPASRGRRASKMRNPVSTADACTEQADGGAGGSRSRSRSSKRSAAATTVATPVAVGRGAKRKTAARKKSAESVRGGVPGRTGVNSKGSGVRASAGSGKLASAADHGPDSTSSTDAAVAGKAAGAGRKRKSSSSSSNTNAGGDTPIGTADGRDSSRVTGEVGEIGVVTAAAAIESGKGGGKKKGKIASPGVSNPRSGGISAVGGRASCAAGKGKGKGRALAAGGKRKRVVEEGDGNKGAGVGGSGAQEGEDIGGLPGVVRVSFSGLQPGDRQVRSLMRFYFWGRRDARAGVSGVGEESP